MDRGVALHHRVFTPDVLAGSFCNYNLAVLHRHRREPASSLTMKGYVSNIEQLALENSYFRNVLYTDERVQLVVMSLNPNEDIGEEVHQLDQFIRVEKGEGKSVLDGEEHALSNGSAIIIPSGTRHNIINTSSSNPMKLYTLYAPPNHKEGTIHKTKAEAEANEEHFGV
jgi:mannose-6-phosphate isomerase-like protein (cupin superfamily)